MVNRESSVLKNACRSPGERLALLLHANGIAARVRGAFDSRFPAWFLENECEESSIDMEVRLETRQLASTLFRR
jgi:hypothetical protein